MNIFLDANILVAVLNKEYPVFSYAARLVSLSDNPQYRLFTSPLCLAIAFYFAEKKQGTQQAKAKIALLSEHLNIAHNSKEGVLNTLNNKRIHDFEDGLEFYAAKEQNCTCIVTEDRNGFYFSEIEVLNSECFFNKHVLN